MEYNLNVIEGKLMRGAKSTYDRVQSFHAHQIDKTLGELVRNRTRGYFEFWNGYTAKLSSDRYALFFNKGFECAHCGLKGSYFSLEKDKGTSTRPHLNLYAINATGHEVLMTKDHIIPKSKGGANHFHNYQVLCQPCNMEKGANL